MYDILYDIIKDYDDTPENEERDTEKWRGSPTPMFNLISVLRADMCDLTGFQRDLLYTIAGFEEPHGLAIKDELEDYYEKEIHHGRLYPNLDTLVDKGLVEKGAGRPPYKRLLVYAARYP